MCGDRLETDILFGKRGGISTLLVLTGTHTRLISPPAADRLQSGTGSSTLEDVDLLPSEERPDYIAPCIGDFLKSQF